MISKQSKQRAAKQPSFYDRKVQTYGYTRTVSMGRIIPKDWAYVRVRVIERQGNKIIISITKLLGGEQVEPSLASG